MGEKRVCPHCGSEDLAYSDERQGFGAGKAAAGALAFGPLGLLAGTLGSGKRRITVRCNGCLRTFSADVFRAEERRQANRKALANLGAVGVAGYSAASAAVLAWLSYLLADGSAGHPPFVARAVLLWALMAPLFLVQRAKARRDA